MATRARQRRTMPRRQRVWARQRGSLSLPASSGGRAQASLDSQFSTEYGTTRLPVGTTIGGLLVQYQSTQLIARAASTDHFVLGIGLFDESTAAETPSPVSEPHADWMWRLLVPAAFTSVGGNLSTTESQQGPIRIKSMRKISELNVRPWLIAENFGVTTFDIFYDVSLMLMLP